ncbi:hypothetical protein ASG73_11095 [Janibacter sp. Soil728]|uniref:DUF3710 domain-containing protein n=1 Tax=Janibacter sp. Soil728 TaxID=1736393 RepID=UPI0006F8675C|nr:DUF3710 domain-containing protein [Janibacter sp. Soil728]KRE36874.1 hypothetical protein ASG73_11095 [Janibacter sp. Soil728]
MFGRKKKNAADEATEPDTTTASDGADLAPSEDAPAQGPRDISDVTDTSSLVDLGSILLAPSSGTELRLEVDQGTNDVTAVQIADDDGAVQVQVFAAPRSSGIWDDIRDEIAAQITGNGGTVEQAKGPFGAELLTRLAQPGPQGRTVFAPAIFAGAEGPRWFLRAVYSGAAAVDESTRARFDEVMRSIVVSRGEEPRAPREMLPLQMPTAPSGQDPVEEDGDAQVDDLKPFQRGPEITEVR